LNAVTDDVLIKRLAAGDPTALWLIYERHQGVVFRFIYRVAGSRDLAEDLTHDAFVALMLRPQDYDATRASLRTYLCGIVRNLERTQRRRRRPEAELPHEAVTQSQSIADPLSSLMRHELARRVQQAVLELKPLLREVLVLIEYEGFTLAETASVVGTRIGTVKTRLHRARAAMRQALAPYLGRSESPMRKVES